MDHSMAQQDVPAPSAARHFQLSAWKTALSTISAIVLALLFLVAGIWKITDPLAAATRMTQALLPAALSLPVAITAGIVETFAAVLLFVPRYRRWGAWLTGLMLVAFLLYFGINYSALQGEECNCFPWIKRAVGPAFFIGDAVMLLLALLAGLWAPAPWGKRGAGVILGAVTVFALASYGVTAVQQSGLKAPETITVDGQPVSLQQGRFFLYFFDPECAHCWKAAQAMGKYNWGDVNVIAIATANPQYGQQFLAETGLVAKLSPDVTKLRETFQFVDAPYGVALVNGRQKAAFPAFDGQEPEKTLRELEFIQ